MAGKKAKESNSALNSYIKQEVMKKKGKIALTHQ